MPSTYTLNNGIELIATGEQSGTWGDTTNTNFELLDTSLDGQVTVTLASTGSSGSPNTLPVSDGAASNGRNRLIIFDDSSDLGGTAFVQLTPNDAEKIIYVRNSLSGSRSILLFQGTYSASNDYEVPAGTTAIVFFNGAGAGAVAANVFNNAHFDNLNIVGDVTIGDDLTLNSDGAIINIGADNDLQITHSGTAGTITNATGDLTVDVAGDIILDADGADFKLRDGGAGFFTISNSSLDAVLKVEQSNEDFIIKGNDGGSEITALTLDMSEAGAATFNSGVTLSGDLTVDTDTLYVDSTNDRVGINLDSPSTSLDVNLSQTLTSLTSPAQAALRLRNNNGAADNYFTALSFTTSTTGVGTDSVIVSYNESAGNSALAFYTDGSNVINEAMRIDSSQRVLIGDTSSQAVYEDGSAINSTLQINNSEGSAMIARTIGSGRLFLARNQSVVLNSPLGEVSFNGGDGTNLRQAAKIIASVDGGPATGDMPGRLQFYTSADGAATPQERMRITSAGLIGLNSISPTQEVSIGGNIDLQSTSGSNATLRRIAWRNTNSSGYEVANIQGYTGGNIYEGQIAFQTKDSGGSMVEAMRIDSSQRVLIGTTASNTTISANPALQVAGTTYDKAMIGAYRYSNDGPTPAHLTLSKSRGTSVNTQTIVQSGDYVGSVNFAGSDGTNFVHAATIEALVDGTPGSNDMPGRLMFSTTADGAATPTEVMRLTSDRVLKLSSSFNSGSLTTFPSYTGEGGYLKAYVNGGGAGPYPRYLDIASLGDGSWGGVIRFLGNKDSSATAVEHARFDRDGHFKIGTVSGSGKLTVSNNQTATDNLELAAFSGSDVNQRLTINNFFCGSDEDRVGLLFENQGTGNMRVWMGDDLKLYSKSGNPTSDNDGNYFVQVNSSGNIVMPNGNGIDFSATSNGSGTTTSEILDDYEEGTFNATATSDGSATLSVSDEFYTKIGRIVHVSFTVTFSGSGNSGSLVVDDLPFSAVGTTPIGIGREDATDGYAVYGRMTSGSDDVDIWAADSISNSTAFKVAAGNIRFSITYKCE